MKKAKDTAQLALTTSVVFPLSPNQDSVSKARQLLDQVYPISDAREDDEIKQFRHYVIQQLNQLENKTLNLADEGELEKINLQLENIIAEQRKMADESFKRPSAPRNIQVNIGSSISLEKKAQQIIGPIKVIGEQHKYTYVMSPASSKVKKKDKKKRSSQHKPLIPLVHLFNKKTCLEKINQKEDLNLSGQKTIAKLQPLQLFCSRSENTASLISALAVLPNGRLASAQSKTITVWNLETGEQIHLHGHTQNIRILVVCEGYLISGSEDYTIRKWNLDKNYQSSELTKNNSAVTILLARSEGRLISSTRDKKISFWNVKIDEKSEQDIDVTEAWPDDVGYLQAMIISPDNRFLITAWSDNIVRFFNLRNKTWCKEFIEGNGGMNKGSINALILWPKKEKNNATWYLTAGSSDGIINVWNIKTTDICFSIIKNFASQAAHSKKINAFTILADGRLASVSDESSIKLWTWNSQTQIYHLDAILAREDKDGIYAVLALPCALVSGSEKGILQFWAYQLRSLTIDDITYLLRNLKSEKLSRVNLNGIEWGNAAIDSLRYLINQNTALKLLDLRGVKLDQNEIKELKKLIKSKNIELLYDASETKKIMENNSQKRLST